MADKQLFLLERQLATASAALKAASMVADNMQAETLSDDLLQIQAEVSRVLVDALKGRAALRRRMSSRT